MASFHIRRFGQYLCDVTVTKDDSASRSTRYRAHLDQVERQTDTKHVPIPIEVADTFGPSGNEAIAVLDNGFLACADPIRLQTICARLGPADVQAFFDRWAARLLSPLTARDRAAGYTHRLALQQVEVSLTQVFARPVQGRHFFEAVIRENLDLGRPDRVGLLFPLRLTKATPPSPWGYRTRVITDGVEPSLHIEYKSSHLKQYFNEQRALRTETTIKNPKDFYVAKAVSNVSHLRDLGDQVNRKLLEVERVSHQCVLTQDAPDRLQQPTVEAGQRASALRFADPRVIALCQAITGFAHLPRGFHNRDLRQPLEALLGRPYSAAQMTYDLRRLRLKGLIHRIPKTHRYTATSYGLTVASSTRNSISAFCDPSGRDSCRSTTNCRARCAPPWTNSRLRSGRSTRRPLFAA
jgi:hypothetical protein